MAEIAAEVGRLAHSRWRGDYRRWEKSPGNPVCEVDLEANALLRKRLSSLDPEAGFLSEEEIDESDRLERPRVWIVDPIDGTRDFIRGRDGWAVSIALAENGVPVLGALDAPARAERWSAASGCGATRNGEAIRVSGRAVFAGARVPADQLPRADADLVAIAKPNSIALRIAMVAAGEADLLATLRWGHEWDVAAAAVIAIEAGATVSDAFGKPLAFNQRRPEAFGVLVTTPAIHAAGVARLAERAEATVGNR